MPKLKTHKGIAKRIKVTGTGKILRRKASRSHNLSKMQASTARTLVKDLPFADGDLANVKKMLKGYK